MKIGVCVMETGLNNMGPNIEEVLPRHVYLLMNHGPLTLVSAKHGERRNVMAASWVMPLDFEPPKIVGVFDKNTFTHSLIDASGLVAINLPTRAMAESALAVGHHSAEDMPADADKITAFGLSTFESPRLKLPLIEGCSGWLECRLIREPHIEKNYDLFIADVVAAWADPRFFSGGRWQPGAEGVPRPATLHYIANGLLFESGPLSKIELMSLRDSES
ncbi:MAG: flavin reductase family protein [Gammaproteobacteria bacterium]